LNLIDSSKGNNPLRRKKNKKHKNIKSFNSKLLKFSY
jgi:hypothetical protein